MPLSDFKFLIVDDHFLVRHVVDKTLTSANITKIDWAADGEEAIRKITEAYEKGDAYDVVSLDWGIPNISGLQVLKFCRKDKRFDNMAIVMFTAESEESSILLAIAEGATAYIKKPIAPEELLKKFSELIQWLENRKS